MERNTMKTFAMALTMAAAFATSGWAEDYSAEVAQDQKAIQTFRAARVAALKAHDQAAAARAAQQLQAAYERSWTDQSAAKASASAPAQGETRAAQLALIQAKDNYHDAVESGDKAAIAKARAEVRAAYHEDWVVRHAKHPTK